MSKTINDKFKMNDYRLKFNVIIDITAHNGYIKEYIDAYTSELAKPIGGYVPLDLLWLTPEFYDTKIKSKLTKITKKRKKNNEK